MTDTEKKRMKKIETFAFVILVLAIINIVLVIAIAVMNNTKKYPQRFCTNCGYYIGSEISYGGDE